MSKYCTYCEKVTEEIGEACSLCAKKYISGAKLASDIRLAPNPSQNVTRIICIGHGTYNKADQRFGIPRNVTVRFRTTHASSTGGGNELRVRPDEDLKFGKLCYNYRLWSLTGSEKSELPRSSSQDAEGFIRGWRCKKGANNYIYVSRPGNSVRLSDITYGLGGAASIGKQRSWEVVWLACREIIHDNANFAELLEKEKSCIYLN